MTALQIAKSKCKFGNRVQKSSLKRPTVRSAAFSWAGSCYQKVHQQMWRKQKCCVHSFMEFILTAPGITCTPTPPTPDTHVCQPSKSRTSLCSPILWTLSNAPIGFVHKFYTKSNRVHRQSAISPASPLFKSSVLICRHAHKTYPHAQQPRLKHRFNLYRDTWLIFSWQCVQLRNYIIFPRCFKFEVFHMMSIVQNVVGHTQMPDEWNHA